MRTVLIENECGQEVEVKVSQAVADFMKEDDAYMERLHNIDSKQLRLLHFDKVAWENMENLSTGYSTEDEYFCVQEREALAEDTFYRNRLALCRKKLPQIRSALTKTQWRRYILHWVYGKTYREIAAMEGSCGFRAIGYSVEAAEKKIKKILGK